MNGRVAKLTRPPRRLSPRNYRTMLLAVCCAMSLALLGAVRLAPQLRPEPLLAVNATSAEPAEPSVVGWDEGRTAETDAPDNETARPVGALHDADDVVLATPAGFSAGAELLIDRTTSAAAVAAIVPAMPAPVAPPPAARVGPRTRTMLMEVTAYCPCPRCCGPRAQGITASGRRVSYNGGRFVAADTRLLKFNTKLRIPGYANNAPVEVIDRGGAIKGNKLDVYFHSHQEARKWGRQKLWVTVEE